jgi:hypothetical protein
MWLHRLQPIPYGSRAVLAACALSAVVASLLPGLTPRERVSAVPVVPCAFVGIYVIARLILPIMGGTAKFGTSVATVLFYAMPVAGVLVLCLAPFGMWSDTESTPSYRAYDVATSLPGALGFAAAALHRIRSNTGVA